MWAANLCMLCIQHLETSHQEHLVVVRERVTALKWQLLASKLIVDQDHENFFNVFRRQEGLHYLRLAKEALSRTKKENEQLDRRRLYLEPA